MAEQLREFVGDPLFWRDAGITVRSAAIGFVFGVSAACVSVALTWPFPLVRQFLAPLLVVANTVPRIALAPLFILWFGVGWFTTGEAQEMADLAGSGALGPVALRTHFRTTASWR